MIEYTIELDDAEVRAMEHIAVDPQDWIQNVFNFKIQSSTNEFLKRYVEKQQAQGKDIITDTDLLISESAELPANQRITKEQYKIFPDDPFNPFLIP